MKIEIAGATDIGKKRQVNEDSLVCFDLSRADGPAAVIAVADGIGGHVGGKIASSIAIKTLEETARKYFSKEDSDSYVLARMMEDASQAANHSIFNEAAANTDLKGMGSTMVAALIAEGEATISNVGDSRAYLIRDGSVRQLTYDHSWRAEQMRLNIMSEEEINQSPFKHTITRSLGFQSDVEIDIFQIKLNNGDYLLLCSDGLYESLTDELVVKIVHNKRKPDKISQKLVKTANQRSGHDNITAAVARVDGIEAGKDKGKDKKIKPSDTVKLDKTKFQGPFGDTIKLPPDD
jgi:serine/threonine protein phosphatase PrpC